MTNQAQAVRDFIKASKERTPGEWRALQSQSYCEPHPIEFYYGVLAYENGEYKTTVIDNEQMSLTDYPNAPHDMHFIAAASRLDLDNLLDVVVKMAEALVEINAWGLSSETPSSGQSGINERARVWSVLKTALALAQPYIDAVGER